MAWRRPWIKLWVEMLEDPKVVVTLGQAQRWVWIGLLLATSRSPEPGRMLLPNGRPMSARHLRQVTRCTEMPLEEFEAALDLMQEQEMAAWRDGVLELVNWHKRQDPQDITAPERMRRYRDRLRRGNGHPAVTDVTLGVMPSLTGADTPEVTGEVTSPVTGPVTGDVTESQDPAGPGRSADLAVMT